MRKVLFIVIPALVVGHALAADNAPIAVVTELAALDIHGDWPPIFAHTPTPIMRKYFSSSFNQAWATAMKHTDYPVFDADPLTGAQGAGGIKSISAHMVAPNRVATAMTLRDGTSDSVEFLMLHTPTGEWLINDIRYPDGKSLRQVLGAADR